MNVFRVFLRLELKRFLGKRNIVIFLLFLIVSLYFLLEGINRFQRFQTNKETFKQIEKMKIKQYVMYTQYGSYGFRLMFVPSPLSIFFNNSGNFSGLISNIDSGERLNIYHPFKGKTLFSEKNGALMDFSGSLLLLGSLFALYFGYGALHHKKYLKFLSGFYGYKKISLSIIGSRILLLLLLLLPVAGSSWGLLKVNGIDLSPGDSIYLGVYFGMQFLVFLFFFF
ncbi:MAG: hypothetical protein GY950_09160, partial [bacterium]|nr:hypothetical protein [bacterium]